MPKVLEYLSDEKGIYGLGVMGLADSQQLILRPDKLINDGLAGLSGKAYLTTIPKIKKPKDYHESYALSLAVYRSLPDNLLGKQFPSKKATKEENRQYFGIRANISKVFNGMYRRVLAEAACYESLALARRFMPMYRMQIYVAACRSVRARQLIQAYPILGAAVYVRQFAYIEGWKQSEAQAMVERGERMRDIAKFLGIKANWLRKVKPWNVCYVAVNLYAAHDSAWAAKMSFLPESQLGQNRFLRNLIPQYNAHAAWQYIAKRAPWCARKFDTNAITSVRDYLHDTYRGQPVPDMHWHTALERAAEWHRTIEFRKFEELNTPFPEPWLPAGKVGGYDIVPLTTGLELVEEGRRMHHCVGSYSSQVTGGHSYIYSVRKDDKSVATLELNKRQQIPENPEEMWVNQGGTLTSWVVSSPYLIAQLRAECNKEPPPAVRNAANKWLVQNILPGVQREAAE